ncbi:ferredoxin/adrenodoxin reductase [Fomitiporia mediterranea MF3/22]|uniref:ferredoxin/adrenodoxin reductase n=1 Tax=Fomitiporia mediterranea (strain MF3/22) TaxID=694068 RepID=UPI0004407CD4|nr:ferredoxin/adrenodoxin reductase [Fomitiporia mediterranea MF3/22]EJD00604.1 ferredoxin/adrenodoxin reductase [Fomitiporia mediterranea MF3/22]
MPPRIKLAIVGGGPSAFYAASRLLQFFPNTQPRRPGIGIHIYDRLWAPHGLVRYGVAPDHPEVKNCTHKFDESARDERFAFFGNVNVSSTPSPVPHAVNVPLSSLFPHYTHLLLSSGCTVPRLHPALPPSDIVRPALDLVHWYTQHPASTFKPPLERTKHVSVIGHGNVALDVARILLSPVERLEKYDVPVSVLDVLSKSAVQHVSIIGRRGPLEASFTTKELREMMSLPGTALAPLSSEALEAMKPTEGTQLTRQQSRLLQILQKGSSNAFGTTERSWSIDFFRSPTGIATAPSGSSHAARLALAHTTLDKDRKAVSTGETFMLDTDLVLTSLGYRAEPTGEWYEPALGTMRNTGGRVVDTAGKVLRNVYASGWAATGAHGVLASTMLNAHSIIDTIISDLRAQAGEDDSSAELQTGPVPPPSIEMLDGEVHNLLNPNADLGSVPEEVLAARKEGRVTTYEDWKRIDEEEVRRAEKVGKERERMSWDEARTFVKN